jgi:murein DD-endopeptidase MepM/ murein hydrolase activator NlpD
VTINVRWRVASIALALVALTTVPARSALAQPEVAHPAARAPSSMPPAVPTRYVVREDDTLTSIARRRGVSVGAVTRANNLTDANVLRAGQMLTMPPSSGALYAVRHGDTVESVARAHNVSAGGIVAVNGLAEDASLAPGRQLLIPAPRRVDPLFSPAVPVYLAAARASAPTPIRAPAPTSSTGSAAVTTTTRKLPTIAWPLSLKPSRSAITTAFRPAPTSQEPKRHDGIDIAAPKGTAIRAAAGGTVTRAQRGWNGGYGWMVVVDHGDGVSTRYAHLNELSVAVGDRVGPGQQVGTVGSTGLSTGPHLHFELRLRSTPLDPLLALP